MTPTDIKKSLAEVITEIQSSSSLECPELSSSVVPANDIPSFDSKVWLVATTMLSEKIGTEIPDDENIFVDKNSNAALNISQVCELVLKIVNAAKESEEAA